ncbi:hypothetical protein J6590_077741 [Homalodisca vitripennis]|nr:hypothetical protein J6590_077741 [Homalodisca vitripennis]
MSPLSRCILTEMPSTSTPIYTRLARAWQRQMETEPYNPPLPAARQVFEEAMKKLQFVCHLRWTTPRDLVFLGTQTEVRRQNSRT